MVKILSGVTSPILTVFFQALNAKPPKGRDEIYHSNEWVKAMDPFCKQQAGPQENTVNYVIKVPEDQPADLRVEGATLSFLERCFKDAMDQGIYGFMAAKHVLAAEEVLKKAADEPAKV